VLTLCFSVEGALVFFYRLWVFVWVGLVMSAHACTQIRIAVECVASRRGSMAVALKTCLPLTGINHVDCGFSVRPGMPPWSGYLNAFVFSSCCRV
jgi:hypothetical protein